MPEQGFAKSPSRADMFHGGTVFPGHAAPESLCGFGTPALQDADRRQRSAPTPMKISSLCAACCAPLSRSGTAKA
jgi:hypothetical protein